jgi:hypothetical protein
VLSCIFGKSTEHCDIVRNCVLCEIWITKCHQPALCVAHHSLVLKRPALTIDATYSERDERLAATEMLLEFFFFHVFRGKDSLKFIDMLSIFFVASGDGEGRRSTRQIVK